MDTPLCQFVSKVTAHQRLVFGDLRRLQRDVLPAGATTREEIETLLSLDSMGRVDDDWPGYLITTVKDFVLGRSHPAGCIDADTATWLAAALAETRSRTAAAIVRAIMMEAQQVDEVLVTFGRRATKRPAILEAAVDPEIGPKEKPPE